MEPKTIQDGESVIEIHDDGVSPVDRIKIVTKKVEIVPEEVIPEKTVETILEDGTLSDLENEVIPSIQGQIKNAEARVVEAQAEVTRLRALEADKEALKLKYEAELAKLPERVKEEVKEEVVVDVMAEPIQ